MVSDTIRRATGQGWAAGADATWSASRPSCAALSPVVDPRKATRPATTQPTTIQVVRGRTAARRDAMRSPRCRTAGCPRIAKIDESGRYRHRQRRRWDGGRSEEHTSELQSLMRISYAVFCLKKKK